ncbi:MAG: DUF1800 domain-containing protein [Gemmatimonadota bacterium]
MDVRPRAVAGEHEPLNHGSAIRMHPTASDSASEDVAGGSGSTEDEHAALIVRPDAQASRRRFFALGVSMAAASMAGAGRAVAQATQQAPKKSAARAMVKRLLDQAPGASFDPFGKQATAALKGWDSALTRLVRRVTNGVTEDELKLAQKLGYNGYINYHLGYSKIEDGATQTFVGQNYPLLTQTGDQLYNIDQRLVIDQLTEGALYRAAFSKRQLYERMVECWSDHFNIAFPQVNYLKLVDDRDVIRKYALGRFPDLLKASAHSPAMLEYLDNTRNRQRTLNENYAREIMELHTLGTAGGYTQGDVRELARVFTGWTIAGRGTFTFDPTGHDFGAKTVMGQLFQAMPTSAGAAAKSEGDQMLDFLTAHPNTAKFIGRKLLRWLLEYEPSAAQITAVANVYTRTQGDIPAMVRAVLSPANVAAAAPKFKRPYHFLVSSLRATKPAVRKVSTLADRWLRLLGQPLFYWDPPDGYPDRADYWAGGVMQRWNFAVYLTTASGEVTMDINRFIAVNTPEGVTAAINKELFAGEMPDRLKGQLTTYLAAQPNVTQARAREAVALALSSSTFQWT